jgi:hypothetical protein
MSGLILAAAIAAAIRTDADARRYCKNNGFVEAACSAAPPCTNGKAECLPWERRWKGGKIQLRKGDVLMDDGAIVHAPILDTNHR